MYRPACFARRAWHICGGEFSDHGAMLVSQWQMLLTAPNRTRQKAKLAGDIAHKGEPAPALFTGELAVISRLFRLPWRTGAAEVAVNTRAEEIHGQITALLDAVRRSIQS